MLRSANLPTTTSGLAYTMVQAIGEAYNSACKLREANLRPGKSFLKSFLLFSFPKPYQLTLSFHPLSTSQYTRSPPFPPPNILARPIILIHQKKSLCSSRQDILKQGELLFCSSHWSLFVLLFWSFSFPNFFHSSRKLLFRTLLNNGFTFRFRNIFKATINRRAKGKTKG